MLRIILVALTISMIAAGIIYMRHVYTVVMLPAGEENIALALS